MPLISILMPVYNEERFISEAIESVLNQTYTNFELIIVDDGSTDSTKDIIKKYLNDERIQFHQPGKIGKNAAFNLAYKNSKGDFICYFAGDDILEMDSLEQRILPVANKKNDLVTIVSKARIISEIKKFNNVITPRKSDRGVMLGGTVLFSRKLARIIFPLPTLLPNEDKWTVQHLIHFAKIIHVPKVTINYRIHPNNSSSRTNPFKQKTESIHSRFLVYSLFLEKYRDKLNKKEIAMLENLSVAETLRYNKSTLSILFFTNLPFKEKARFIFHSNALLYWLRIRLFSFFSGR